jgi:type I restriction enzyme M protein
VAESAILSIGIFSLAVAAQKAYQLSEVEVWFRALSQGGASLGHWVGIARAVGNEARRTGESVGGLAQATAPRRRGSGLIADLESLVNYRNRVRHGSGPRTRAEIQRGLDTLEQFIFSALESSTFLSRVPWVYINRIRWSSIDHAYTMDCLSLMGDHPDFEPISIKTRQVYADEHLYLEISASELVPIEPFCYLRDCPTCMSAELYYPDHMTSGSVALKNLDRGHQLDDESIATEIRQWSSPGEPSDT